MSTLRSGQAVNAPALTSRAFGDLSDAPAPEVGKVLGWDANGALASLDPIELTQFGWDDIQGPVNTAGGVAAVTNEAFFDTGFPAVFMRHDQDDVLYWTLQFPHRWDPTTDIKFHVHIVPMGDPAAPQVVRFDGVYAWAPYGVLIPALADWTAFGPVSHTVSPGDLRKEAIVSLFTATPAGTTKESACLLVKVRRPGSSDAGDTYTTPKAGGGTAAANVCILTADAHFQINKAGTTEEIPT